LLNYQIETILMEKIKILCIEDNLGDAILVKELLAEDNYREYDFTHVEGIAKIEGSLKDASFDVILLDLNLGDSNGIDTFERIVAVLPECPVIILTGSNDEALAEEIIQKGAQDYLVKDSINTSLLTRSIRYAIERNMLTIELQKSKQIENQIREVEALDKLPKSSRAKITEQLMGIKSMRENSEETFKEYSHKMTKIMDMAVEARMYKTDYDITSKLRDFAEELGYSFAGPQDVVEIYSYALKGKMKISSQEASQIFLEEGRVLLIRVMGYLVTFYRKFAPVNMIFKDQFQNKEINQQLNKEK
jgi:CheY-like chemotaxis protein